MDISSLYGSSALDSTAYTNAANQTASKLQDKLNSSDYSKATDDELIGANVIVKGTTIGNVTDMNGMVTLHDVPANAVLEVSYIGYRSQEVQVKNQTQIRVVLAEDTKALKEIVVVGYGTMEKKQVTSAITSLKSEDMMVGVSGADISSALQGKIGGLVMPSTD